MKLKNLLLPTLLFLCTYFTSEAQTANPNIDFEMGTTAYWNYYRGINTNVSGISSPAVWSLTSCTPQPTLHTITSGSGTDLKIPIVGDGLYSLKLSKDTQDMNADAASYNIHVPATGSCKFIYRFALFLDDPGHPANDNPRFEFSVTDSATGTPVSPYSFIIIPATTPGFTFPMPWVTKIMDLSSMSGKTVTVSFRVGGCTLSGHQGYAYIDMNDGAVANVTIKCHGNMDTLAVSPGDSLYNWTDSATFTAAYGTMQTLVIPSPSVTITYAAISTPYYGYGTTDTFYYRVTRGFTTNKSHDTAICYGSSVSLTAGATGPLTYAWTPSTGLSCTTCDTVTATPPLGTTSYYVTTTNSNHCYTTDIIKVATTTLAGTITGSHSICTGTTSTFSDSFPGGKWSSSNTAVTTIDSITGMATGVGADTATITYTLTYCGTFATFGVTVFATPGSIAGATTVCSGATTLLTDAVTGGIWSSSNTTIAVPSGGPYTGIISGVSVGTAIITYSNGPCTVLTVLTVSPVPAAIMPVTGICSGSTIMLSDAVSGGSWSSGNTGIATIGTSSGIATGIGTGTAVITYGFGSCAATYVVTVIPVPPAFTGTSIICTGATDTLSDAVTGGAWTSSNTAIATIGLTNGVTTGMSAGTCLITYTLGGCITYTAITINSSPGPIFGTTAICEGATDTLSDVIGGGLWNSSNTAIVSAGITSGVVSGISAGTSLISYALGACITSTAVTVNPLPTVSATFYATCSDVDTLTVSGSSGTTFSWSPATGLSCTSCDTATLNPAATITYTVTGTNIFGCTDISMVAINGNRISGHITFGGPTPDTLDMKVWLIQYNPSDSSILALDSTLTCIVDSIAYYEFDGKSSGNYMTKAMLLYGNPADSNGYVPTYSLSTPHWDSAATSFHTGGSDSLHITMVYGIVPPGPGFIGGYVYSGAGKGTSGDEPASGMLILLESTASHVLTHTYTDGTGAYSFGNLAYGDYIVYPEDYIYKTTPSSAITLNDTTQEAHNIDFRQFTGSRIIIPYGYSDGVQPISSNKQINVFPNPSNGTIYAVWTNKQTGSATVEVTDVLGRKVYRANMNINASSGQAQISLNGLIDGVYVITIRSGEINYCGKLVIEK